MPTGDKAGCVNAGEEARQVLIENERCWFRFKVTRLQCFDEVKDVSFGQVMRASLETGVSGEDSVHVLWVVHEWLGDVGGDPHVEIVSGEKQTDDGVVECEVQCRWWPRVDVPMVEESVEVAKVEWQIVPVLEVA